MRHSLTVALQSFQGVLIVVSHDRSLLEATTDSFLLIDQGYLKTFEGDLNDYRRLRLAQSNPEAAPPPSAAGQNRKDEKRLAAQIRQQRAQRGKPIQQKIEKAEQLMAKLSAEQAECEAFLADEEAYKEHNKAKLHQYLAKTAEVKVQLAQIEEDWLALQEQLEAVYQAVEQEFGQQSLEKGK